MSRTDSIELDEQLPRIYRVLMFDEAAGQVGFFLANLPDLSKPFEVYPVDDSYERTTGLSFCASKYPAVKQDEVFIDDVRGLCYLHRNWIGRDVAVRCIPLEAKAPLPAPSTPLAAMLQEILDCPHELDHATTEALPGASKQVLFRYTIPYAKVAEARILLAKNS